MIGNFIYYIVALLIYVSATEEAVPIPGRETIPLSESFAALSILTLAFIFMTWIRFKHFEKRISKDGFQNLDRVFNTIMSRQSLVAIVVFAILVYGFELPQSLSRFSAIFSFTAINAIAALGIFIGHLAILWALAYDSYRRLYLAEISRKSYVVSNISFAVVLVPWFLLTLIVDLIVLLPFESLKTMLATDAGQLVCFFVFLMIVLFVHPFLIRILWRCKSLENGPARQRIEALCAEAEMAYSDILYWPIFGGRMITAGVMGISGKCRYILVTEALLRYLKPEEIDTVIAHEIGHIKKKHLVLYVVLFMGFLILLTLFELPMWVIQTYLLVYAGRIFEWVGGSGPASPAFSGLIGISLVVAAFVIYVRYLFGYFMRNFERQADTYVFAMFSSAVPLISTFDKIVKTSGLPADRPNWHHFSIAERVDYLEKCETDRSWITKQDRKIKRSLGAYFIGVCALAIAAYTVSTGEVRDNYRLRILEELVISEMEENPEAWRLAKGLGKIFYDHKKFQKAIDIYEKALLLKPDAPEVLNNLAWLFATCDKERFRDPVRALALAQKAAALSEESHIIDTLAESYYVNGMFEEAVRAEERALELVKTKEHEEFFREQLEKFRKALETGFPVE